MPFPPLVEPGPALSAGEVSRYSRHLLLPDIGVLGQRRLRAAKVLVVGAGGLGSPVLLYLAAAGVGTIGIVDDDVVEASNLQRQVVHGQSDLGRAKVESARDRVLEVNPDVEVVLHEVRLDSSNALEILDPYDVVLDGTDNFATRYLVNDACAILGIPEVWGSIFRFDGQVSVFWAEHGPTYRDLHPEPPPPGSVPSCAEGGVLGVLCGAVGSVMATEAIKLITGAGEPLVGRVLVYDALEMSWRTVRVRPNPALGPITSLVDYEEFCGLPQARARQSGEDAVVSATDLARMLAAREAGEDDFVLVDVREPHERDIVVIPGAVCVPVGRFRSGEAVGEVDRLAAGRRVVLHCKSGVRSADALAVLRSSGHRDAVHLAGGVLAWVRDVDPSLPTY